MRHTELFYALALQKAEGIGDIVAKKLIGHAGSAEDVFKSRLSDLSSVVGRFRLRSLKSKSIFDAADREIEFIEKNRISASFYLDDNYPEKLKHCADGPIVLFSRGNISLDRRKIISVVGTRQITPYGSEFCRKLISDLSPLNPVIISGFAYGVDIVAHQAAIENGLQTIGVLAHGLDQIYPKRHQRFASSVEENGGFITEFSSGTEPFRENFVKRNRIVAGLSEATIVIESADKGGSLITANFANDYNRDVFAVPGRTTDRYSEGCNKLIRSQKAHLLTSAADLVYMMGWDACSAIKPVQKQLFVSLENDEQFVYDYLVKNGREMLDTIAIECGFPIFKISPLLLNMELKGVVRPLPGKIFEAV